MEPGQVIVFLIGTVVIMFGAYYATYYIGTKAAGQTRSRFKNRYIAVIDRFAVARDKSFCIVEIAGKVYIVGVTNQSMTLLDMFDAAAFDELTAEVSAPQSWKNTPVGQYGNKLTRRLTAFIASRKGHVSEESDDADGSTFAETMKAAQTKDLSGQTEELNGSSASAEPPGSKEFENSGKER